MHTQVFNIKNDIDLGRVPNQISFQPIDVWTIGPYFIYYCRDMLHICDWYALDGIL